MKIFSIITLCLLICVTFSHADLMDRLVLYMPLDEGSGSTTKDFSANGFEGEVVGNAKWVDGQFGKALQFAAAADHVVVEAVTIGTWDGEAWTGRVDEVRLWNRAFPTDKIKVSINQDAASFLTPVEPEGKLATSWVNIKLTR